METPFLSGRMFTEHDDARAPQVAIVNKLFALVYLGDPNPVGKRFGFNPEKPDEFEVIGMAEDTKYTSQRQDVEPTVYLSWRQSLKRVGSMTFEIRTTGDPLSVVGGIREAVREVDSNLPISNIRTQLEQAEETLSMERLFAKLLSMFGLIAQLLAAVGLYGVMAYSVSQRTQEIGIRMALGANRASVLRMVLRQGMTLTIVGVAFGITGAFVLTRYVETLTDMLFGIEARDPVTFIAIPVGLTVVALLACLVPARRATKVDPLVALRYE
jgi:predicted permease